MSNQPDKPRKPEPEQTDVVLVPPEDNPPPEPVEPTDPYADITLPMDGSRPKVIRKPAPTTPDEHRAPAAPPAPQPPGTRRPRPTNAQPGRVTRPNPGRRTPAAPATTTNDLTPTRPTPPSRQTRG